jgi:ATP/maltotriose-dependent transcriptional regulator MalT
MTEPKNAQLILPDAYPQMMGRQDAARALLTLHSPETAAKAQAAVEAAIPPLRAAILQYVGEMEAAGADMGLVFEKVHEIRGVAETAGLVTTGRIAEILGRYMDDMVRIDRPMDTAIVALHVSAIARAARAEEDDVKMGEAVAAELATLVARRLANAGQS